MKKYITYIYVLVATISVFALSSCKGDSVKEKNTKESEAETYKCPMDCENGKVYTKQGICPMCEMELEKTSSI